MVAQFSTGILAHFSISIYMRMQVVDEIILYTVPFIAGTGKYFFQSALPPIQLTLVSQKKFPNGVTCHIYNRMTSERTA